MKANITWLVETKKAPYIAVIKTNQPTAYAQLAVLPWASIKVQRTASATAHGRRESRSIKTCAIADNLGGIAFPHAHLAIRVHHRRKPGDHVGYGELPFDEQADDGLSASSPVVATTRSQVRASAASSGAASQASPATGLTSARWPMSCATRASTYPRHLNEPQPVDLKDALKLYTKLIGRRSRSDLAIR
ncbi:hypothetical protein [Streptomyces actuosus]|uniref:hypothetical protein n=1 Tax=Streptomyces actuosus TaxID=1885 RepID=UPI0027D9D61A|nr:hypothetical protein [Streptomyces actuosus]